MQHHHSIRAKVLFINHQYLEKKVEAGPYGPSMETSRWAGGDKVDSFWNNVWDHFPVLLMTMLKVSESVVLHEVIEKGCHCNLDILAIFMKIILVGA
jgi:hypothetical protein